MSKKKDDLTTTVQIRLYPTPEQSRLLMAHCQEYISTVNMLVQAHAQGKQDFERQKAIKR